MSRIAVATQEGGLDDQVSRMFGRCKTYTFVEFEGDEITDSKVVQNQFANTTSGAGIQAAGFVANEGVDAVIAGNYGPNVISVLSQSEVELFQVEGMKVKDAVKSYIGGELSSVSQATTSPMSGSGGGVGRGMGRRMSKQNPVQQRGSMSSFDSSGQESYSQEQGDLTEKRLQKLEERIEDLEEELNKIGDSLEDLGKKN